MPFPTQILPVFTMAECEMMNIWEFPCGMIGPIVLASGTECVVFPPDLANEGYKVPPDVGPDVPEGFASVHEWLNDNSRKREVLTTEFV